MKFTDRIKHSKLPYAFRAGKELYMEDWVMLDRLLPIILFHREGCLVEIGVGVSTFFMCKHGHDFERTVYSVDMNSEKLKKYSTTGLYSGHKPMWGTSEDFIKTFNEPCAAVLIDGAHDYEIAKMEFDFFFGKLVEGGVIFIHDTYPPVAEGDDPAALLVSDGCGDVWKLRGELEQRRDEMEVFTWPYTAKWMGLTMVLKKEKERPYWG
uniref:Putative methyltransferase n=1 Tax=viral metagenome TaxID=1070528 RepID=A0A6H1ZFK7_9ZZZZ